MFHPDLIHGHDRADVVRPQPQHWQAEEARGYLRAALRKAKGVLAA
ncbi:MAG: hypothetical protein Q4G22_10205 [Paracoccus sp. (in: a-proteobacteria)]|nr:hypothetical protein [Paracoccus sp. (in: a-proteobacteria)]